VIHRRVDGHTGAAHGSRFSISRSILGSGINQRSATNTWSPPATQTRTDRKIQLASKRNQMALVATCAAQQQQGLIGSKRNEFINEIRPRPHLPGSTLADLKF
jgi:hypothetical protein